MKQVAINLKARKQEPKPIYSINNSSYLFKVKVDEDNESKIFCTLFMASFPTRNSIFWEQPLQEIKPYELANIMEVWANFDFYFKMLQK